MSAPDIKQRARQMVERLADQASWDDLLYEIYVQQAIDNGLVDADAGRVISHEEVAKRFSFPA
jgi:predicted transcriptional regulator